MNNEKEILDITLSCEDLVDSEELVKEEESEVSIIEIA